MWVAESAQHLHIRNGRCMIKTISHIIPAEHLYSMQNIKHEISFIKKLWLHSFHVLSHKYAHFKSLQFVSNAHIEYTINTHVVHFLCGKPKCLQCVVVQKSVVRNYIGTDTHELVDTYKHMVRGERQRERAKHSDSEREFKIDNFAAIHAFSEDDGDGEKREAVVSHRKHNWFRTSGFPSKYTRTLTVVSKSHHWLRVNFRCFNVDFLKGVVLLCVTNIAAASMNKYNH